MIEGHLVFSLVVAAIALTLQAGLAVLLLVAGFNRTANRALAVTLFANVWAGVFMSILSVEGVAPEIGERWLLYARHAWFVDSLAIFAFLANYPERREVLPRWATRLWPYVGLGLVFTAIQLFWPRMGISLQGSGPLVLVDFFADLFAALIVPLILLHEVRRGRFERPLGPIFLAGFLPTYFIAADLMSVLSIMGAPVPSFLSSRGNLDGIGVTGVILDFLIPLRFLLGLMVLGSFVLTGARSPRVRVPCLAVLGVLVGHITLRLVLMALGPSPAAFLVAHAGVLPLHLATFGFLAYVALHDQTLGLNRKVRIGISRAALAMVFLGVFVVVAQVAENVLSEELGYITGGIVAGALLFAVAPLQRVAERLAGVGRAPPDERVAEVYREAVELTLMDRTLTPREERHLAHLAERLGLAAGQAMDIRLDVQQGMDARARSRGGTTSRGRSETRPS